MKINYSQPLTEEFIEKHKNNIDWLSICMYQKLSESFIEKYQDEVDWDIISQYQKLSETFIEKFKDQVCWVNISNSQKLSESFIEKYRDKLNWVYIYSYQTLSEEFIEKFQDKLYWKYISQHQKLSEQFIEKYKYSLSLLLIPNKVDNRTLATKMQNMKAYAFYHHLDIEDNYLYAYREHDKWGRGMFNKTTFYDKPGVYRDWKCNLDEDTATSYGLGISSKGNVLVRVHVKDWGVWVKDLDKARVWAFELLEINTTKRIKV